MTDINGRPPSRQARSGPSFAALAEQLNARVAGR